MSSFTKGQVVTFNVMGLAARPVVAEYVRPIKPSAKYPKGGHRLTIDGGKTTLAVASDPTPHADRDAAMAHVAAAYGVKA